MKANIYPLQKGIASNVRNVKHSLLMAYPAMKQVARMQSTSALVAMLSSTQNKNTVLIAVKPKRGEKTMNICSVCGRPRLIPDDDDKFVCASCRNKSEKGKCKHVILEKNIVYYALVTRNGWIEFHVSRDKANVEKLEALSRRIPAVSSFAPKFVKEVQDEVKAFELKRVCLESDYREENQKP